MPPMTLEQAVDLLGKIRSIGHTLPEFVSRRATPDSLLDHAVYAYTAGVLLLNHATEAERHLVEVTSVLARLTAANRQILEHPVWGSQFKLLMDTILAESGEM